jgi:hypothetical protein
LSGVFPRPHTRWDDEGCPPVRVEGAALLMRVRRTTVALALAAAFVVVLIISALGGFWGGPPSYGEKNRCSR